MAKINQEEYQVLKGLDDKWKWITKDKYSDNPELFQVKPYKSGVVWFWDGHTEVEKIYNNELFQFIQWEDEEPYNIQELIDEYLDDEYGYFNMKLSREFEEFIKKRDEPEVLSDKWIDDNSVYASSDGVTEEYVHVDDLQNLLVPKQELPVIPEFVADWIEEVKPDNSLRVAFEYIAQQKKGQL